MNSQDVLNYTLASIIVILFSISLFLTWKVWRLLQIVKPILKWREVMMMANKGISPIVAGVTGAALGAVAGLALSDRGNRRKLGRVIEQTRERGEATYHEIKRGVLKKKLPKIMKKR